MEWNVVHYLLVKLEKELVSGTSFSPRATSRSHLLAELIALDERTGFAIESAIRQLGLDSPLPHLDPQARFMLHLRILHALPLPVFFDIPCSASGNRLVPEIVDSSDGLRCALSWLLDDLWAAGSESFLTEFVERAIAKA